MDSTQNFFPPYSVDEVNEIIESLAYLAWSIGMASSSKNVVVDPRELGSRIARVIRKHKLLKGPTRGPKN